MQREKFADASDAVHLERRARPVVTTYVDVVIEAAGGVVWRTSLMSRQEVLVIHRPHHDDWSLPKGKRERRESALECALREVREETGLRCVAGAELPEVRYQDRRGRQRLVRYWAMQVVRGDFRANNEVDAIRWVEIDQAGGLLTYAHDLVVVRGLDEVLAHVA